MSDPNDTSMQDLKPTVWIGKQGCTETMIEEIVAQLKNRHTIKVKWLQNTEVDPAAVATLAKADLVRSAGEDDGSQREKRCRERQNRSAERKTLTYQNHYRPAEVPVSRVEMI